MNRMPEEEDDAAPTEQTLRAIMAFVSLAEGFDAAFVKWNFEAERDRYVKRLVDMGPSHNVDFLIIDVPPDVKRLKNFLGDCLRERAASPESAADQKKRVIIITGLENSLRDGPEILADLNFAREAYPQDVPHPVLFWLPEEALAQFIEKAPDFWRWRSDVFELATAEGPSRRRYEPAPQGKSFEEKVAAVYRLFGYKAEPRRVIEGVQVDLFVHKREAGFSIDAVVECKDKRVTAKERNQILAEQRVVQQKYPAYRWLVVSSRGFAEDIKTALEAVGITCRTYDQLLHELIPLENYVRGLVLDFEDFKRKSWNGEDWFIEPFIQTDVTRKTFPALKYIERWRADDRLKHLTLLGDLGTGKTTLAGYMAWKLGQAFLKEPHRHPAPVLIPLGDVRKSVRLESIIVDHFSQRGLPNVIFSRFEHLVHTGQVLLIFDAFDDMADRIDWEQTKENFYQLKRIVAGQAKIMLTCRTHYFKDRNEAVEVIGQGPTLSEVETELYRAIATLPEYEITYLQEFTDDQINAYLRKSRGDGWAADWEKSSASITFPTWPTGPCSWT